MIRNLRLKFIAVVMAVVLVILSAAFVLVIQITGQNMHQQTEQTLRNVLSGTSQMQNRHDNTALPYFLIHTDLWGNLVVAGTVNPDRYTSEQLQQFWRTAMTTPEQSGEISEYSLRFLRNGSSCAFVDISGQQSALSQLKLSCALTGIAAMAVFLILSIFLARWMVKPVEQAWAQQRQFVADASHELKTPLTVILTNAELLQDPACSPEDRAVFSESILTMSRQMRLLVEGLLQLARADCGQSIRETEVLDYSALVEAALLPFEPLYFERGLTLESHLEPGITLRGGTGPLSQVVEILLDNGLKYSEGSAPVVLDLRRQGRNQCILCLATPGAPLTDSQCRDIFQRFYRVDPARSRRGSYGLGLSIAQRIVTDHRGRIWAQSQDGMNRFYVTLPTQ